MTHRTTPTRTARAWTSPAFALLAAAGGSLTLGLLLEPPSPATKPTPAEPDPAQTIRDMEKDRAKSPAAMPPSPPPARPGEAAPSEGARGSATRLLREGTFVTGRRARMTRSATGEWVLNFDEDATGPSDAPMTLMPCLNLMSMERVAERGGDSLTFTVSGQVFVYKGRNYILPTMYVINRAGDQMGGK